MRLFKDLSKLVNDALNKGYDTVTSVKLSTKANNDVKYNAELKAKGSSVAGKVGASFKTKDGLNIKKLEISNTGALTSQVNLEDAVDNTTFTLDVHLQPLRLNGNGEKCEVGLDYCIEDARVSLLVSPVLPSSASLSMMAKACSCGVIGGVVSGKFDDSFVTTQADVGFAYHSEGALVSLSTGDFLDKATLGAHLQHSSDLAFAAKVGFNCTNPSNADITLGAVHKIDNNTTLKAKVHVPSGEVSTSNVSIGISKRLSADVKVNVGSVISVAEESGAHSATFGASVELGH